jgi:ComF family protein
MRNGWSRFVHLVPPPVCVACGADGGLTQDLCVRCRADLPWLPNACVQCAMPLPAGSSVRRCGACLTRPPPFSRTVAAFAYDEPVRHLLQRLKFRHKLSFARVLGTMLADAVARSGAAVDLLVPVPLHRSRLRERGYNQALELARPVAAALALPVTTEACHRVQASVAQMTLPANERARNVRGAFRASADIAGQRVAIVDDVMTTGATAAELARELLRGGALEVQVWVCARATLD